MGCTFTEPVAGALRVYRAAAGVLRVHRASKASHRATPAPPGRSRRSQTCCTESSRRPAPHTQRDMCFVHNRSTATLLTCAAAVRRFPRLEAAQPALQHALQQQCIWPLPLPLVRWALRQFLWPAGRCNCRFSRARPPLTLRVKACCLVPTWPSPSATTSPLVGRFCSSSARGVAPGRELQRVPMFESRAQ